MSFNCFMFPMTRRSLLGAVMALLGGRRAARSESPLPVELLASVAPAAGQADYGEKRYRVHATILLFGMALYKRKDVGSGFASVERLGSGEAGMLSLRFGAGSNPERAKGLRRSGVFHEVVLREQGEKERAAYYGFMTSSPEETLDQARKSLESGKDASLYKVISGGAGAGNADSTVFAVEAPQSMAWPHWQKLSAHLRERLEGGRPQSLPVEPGTKTFLRAIHDVIGRPERRVAANVVFNGKLYQLRASKAEDGALTRIDGATERQGQRSPFQLWHRRDGVLPERIEYKPRGFLKLTFEADAQLALATGLRLRPAGPGN